MSDPLQSALERARHELLDNPASDVHTVYRGLKEIGGRLTDLECIVCVVGRKTGAGQIAARSMRPVPQSFEAGGAAIPTDVIEAPPPEVARLPLDQVSPQAANAHQRCFDCPIPGGVQIAPQGADWVGTLGAAIAFPAGDGTMRFGGLTNRHVAHGGRFGVGTPVVQPAERTPWIGRVHCWNALRFDGRPNRLDAALIDCRRTDGPYAPATDTIAPTLLGIGAIASEPDLQPKLGDRVIKAGRTTGVTRGRLVGRDAVTTVNYGSEGNARFEQQYVFRSETGHFSAAGDSGSLIVSESTCRPIALLFAGGGRDTLANPIAFVLDWCHGGFFEAET